MGRIHNMQDKQVQDAKIIATSFPFHISVIVAFHQWQPIFIKKIKIKKKQFLYKHADCWLYVEAVNNMWRAIW